MAKHWLTMGDHLGAVNPGLLAVAGNQTLHVAAIALCGW